MKLRIFCTCLVDSHQAAVWIPQAVTAVEPAFAFCCSRISFPLDSLECFLVAGFLSVSPSCLERDLVAIGPQDWCLPLQTPV